jgi:hypothetical protein
LPEKKDKDARERKGSQMTVVLVLTTAWLVVITLVVVACRMAANADRSLSATAQRGREGSDDPLQNWEDELLTPVEQPIAMPQITVYRGASESAGLQSTAPEHVRHRPQ